MDASRREGEASNTKPHRWRSVFPQRLPEIPVGTPCRGCNATHPIPLDDYSRHPCSPIPPQNPTPLRNCRLMQRITPTRPIRIPTKNPWRYSHIFQVGSRVLFRGSWMVCGTIPRWMVSAAHRLRKSRLAAPWYGPASIWRAPKPVSGRRYLPSPKNVLDGQRFDFCSLAGVPLPCAFDVVSTLSTGAFRPPAERFLQSAVRTASPSGCRSRHFVGRHANCHRLPPVSKSRFVS